jgi:transposase
MSVSKRKSRGGRPSKLSPEFRRDAVVMVIDEQRSIADVARSIGVNEGTLGNWVNRERVERGQRVGLRVDERSEMAELRAENAQLRMERDLLTIDGLLGEGDVDIVSRYACVDDQKAAGFPVTAACTAAGVSRSGYCDWCKTGSSRRVPKHAERSSDGSTGTTTRDCTALSTTSHPSRGNGNTVKRHSHPSGQRGDAQTRLTVELMHRPARLAGSHARLTSTIRRRPAGRPQ